MTSSTSSLLPLSNPLVSPEQLATTSSQLDGVPVDLEQSLRFVGARLIQAAGILLHLPQELIAQAITIFYRFYVGAEGGSLKTNAVKDASAASLYLTAKPSFQPITARSLLNVYAYLTSSVSPIRFAAQDGQLVKPNGDGKAASYILSESEYISARTVMLQTESIILRASSFSTAFTAPHHLALTYLQTLSALPAPATEQSEALALRTIALLNTALLSPQLLYLTHQPNALAVAAIYLAAKETRVKLVGEALEWWEVFDVDREDLGFLVVGMQSVQGWIEAEVQRWGGKAYPLDLKELENELKSREAPSLD